MTIRPASLGLAIAIAVVGLLGLLPGLGIDGWLVAPTAAATPAWQAWRVVTHAVVGYGLLGSAISALFVAWIGSSVEAVQGLRRTLMIAAIGAAGGAVAANWLLPGPSLIAGGSVLAWAFIGAIVVDSVRRGQPLQQQLILIALLLALSFLGGGLTWMVLLAGLAAGAGAAAIIGWWPRPPAPRHDPWAAVDQRRQPKTMSADVALWILLGGLIVIWLMRWVVG